MMKTSEWRKLYKQAVAVCREREVSDLIFVGGVAAAVLTQHGNIYTGISVDTACSVGYCAERNVIGSMLTDGETVIKKVVAVKGDQIIMPCGVCREFMMQLGGDNRKLEVLTNLNPIHTVILSELNPNYWA